MVSKRVNRKIRRESRGFVEFVQWRRIGKLRDIFTRDHALHQRIDHDAAAFGGNSAIGRLAREDGGRQKIMQYTRFMTVGLCIFQGYLLAISFQHPEAYRVALPGISETIARLG